MDREESMGSESGRPYPGLEALVDGLKEVADAVEIDDMEGNIVYVSDSWCQLFEREQQEVTGRRWYSVHRYPPNADRGLRVLWRKAAEEGRSQGIFYLTGSDGSRRRIYYARTLYRNGKGTAVAIVTLYQTFDQVVSDYLLAVLEEQDDGVAVLDADGRVVATNRALCDLAGCQCHELDGVDIRSIMPGIEEALLPDSDGTPLDSSRCVGAWSGSLEVLQKNSSRASVRLRLSVTRDDLGNKIGFVLRANHPQMSRMESEDKVQRMKHELRNVFTAILGNTELMLKEGIGDEAVRERLNYIQVAADSGMERLENM